MLGFQHDVEANAYCPGSPQEACGGVGVDEIRVRAWLLAASWTGKMHFRPGSPPGGENLRKKTVYIRSVGQDRGVVKIEDHGYMQFPAEPRDLVRGI